MRVVAGIVVASVLAACSGGGGASPAVDAGGDAPLVDAAIDGDAPSDGREVDAPVDGVPLDAATDGPPLDAGVVEGTRAVYWRVVASTGSQSWSAVTEVVRVPQGARVAVSTSLTGILGAISFSVTPYARSGAGTSVSGPVESVGLHADQADVLVAPVAYNPSGPQGPRKLHVIDLASAAVTATVTSAALGNGRLTDAVRDGTGFIVGDRDWAARITSAGAVTQTFTFTDFTLVAFRRGPPDQAFGRDGSGALVIEDLTTETRSTPVVPAALAGADLVAPKEAGTLWVRGTIGVATAVAPLGSTVATVLPPGSYVMTTDAQGRLIAITVATGRALHALRIDDARFDGVDGASRIDPTYAGDGQAELALCESVCSTGAPTLTRAVTAGDGSLALFEAAPASPGAGPSEALWWFDAP